MDLPGDSNGCLSVLCPVPVGATAQRSERPPFKTLARRKVIPNMDVKSEVTAQFKQVADEQMKQLAPLTDDLALLDSGLDSLCFAIVVVRLEMSLGVDPFSSDEEAALPVTFGEFVNCYENARK